MIRRCASCGQNNRVPLDKLAATGRCGACKAALPPLGEPLDVDPEAFRAIVNSARVPVLVDFWAAWCAPCRMAAPHVKRVAQELAGKAIVVKVNTEQHADLAAIVPSSGDPLLRRARQRRRGPAAGRTRRPPANAPLARGRRAAISQRREAYVAP